MNAFLIEELDEVNNILLDIYTGEAEEVQLKERFKIINLESANWAFRKLKAIEEKEAEIEKLMDKELKRIQDWAHHDLDKCKDSKQFFEFLLEEYFREQKELDPNFKLSTPYGKVSSRKQQSKWNYDDEKVLEWLEQNDMNLIRMKYIYELDKAEIKKKFKIAGNNVVTEDGEIVEGITIEEQPDSITIKVEV